MGSVCPSVTLKEFFENLRLIRQKLRICRMSHFLDIWVNFYVTMLLPFHLNNAFRLIMS